MCPNQVAQQDKAWQGKNAEAKGRPCSRCGGVGHWRYHHKGGEKSIEKAKKKELAGSSSQRAQGSEPQRLAGARDCFSWLVGKCTKGKDCTFDHDPKKKGEDAIDKPCIAWGKGNCKEGARCEYRHSGACIGQAQEAQQRRTVLNRSKRPSAASNSCGILRKDCYSWERAFGSVQFQLSYLRVVVTLPKIA